MSNFFSSFIIFLSNNWKIISFYLFIVLLIYLNRKKFEFQAKIIALYKTQVGIKWMDKIARFSPRFWKTWGYFGIGIGFIGMVFISYILIKGFLDLVFNPSMPAAVGIVLPGVRIPGAAIFVPFWYGIISIFIVAFIHEFAHGVMARVYNMEVKSSGIVFFGPLIGAFVEPDEKDLKEKPKIEQMSVFAAGPFSNICLGVVVLLLSFLFCFLLRARLLSLAVLQLQTHLLIIQLLKREWVVVRLYQILTV